MGPHTGASLEGRTQLLDQVSGDVGMRSRFEALTKQCSDGSDQACLEIAQNKQYLNQLSTTVHHKRPARASRASPSSNQMNLQAVSKQLEPLKKLSAYSKTYQDMADVKGLWDSSKWQSGALGDVVSSQWLEACSEGNQAACNHIARSNGALNQLLQSSIQPGPPIEAYMPSDAPKPVFVKPKPPQPGLFTSFMQALGLSDEFDNSGVTAEKIPKMLPDNGFSRAPKYKAVWNDGTIAPSLSDNAGNKDLFPAFHESLFSDSVKPSAPSTEYH
ncbi:hypothetical protein GUITHDRAFT_154050 [Guillardia theta CCMP2712]|uniref:Uncharacterized protein n=2 Tax=Guillardia theta TaxID=55529 RepID=L1IXR1_GUITC|nr:hypothetical protein GUITHDRAFT_154050 [Guillardia theta CCMP2712]EKX40669.1 hypothetical protein GUITHDRAFT_154050 [Guillardia theta CCMP2712]|eukprot:XP_005827649.1 hypothetical protein GUITHDRAFT_154050 [Guillardia theta CCMP2712]